MEQLDNILSKVVKDGTLLTVQPGGNHGDSLIYYGFDKYLETTDIGRIRLASNEVRFDAPQGFPSLEWMHKQWRYARHRMAEDIDAVYIHGGGNFNDLWSVGIQCYVTAGRYFDCPIVVGPQSVQFDETDPENIFDRVSNETHFVCREEYSYDIMQETTADIDHVDVYLAEDTALYLEKGDMPVDRFAEDYTLVAMRMDKDSALPTIDEEIPDPVTVSDISKMEPTYEDWVQRAARASHIYTDRLHVALLGLILDKPITWYNTGYHKNMGIYEYSVGEHPNVEFVY